MVAVVKEGDGHHVQEHSLEIVYLVFRITGLLTFLSFSLLKTKGMDFVMRLVSCDQRSISNPVHPRRFPSMLLAVTG